jgi:hypothetical protein
MGPGEDDFVSVLGIGLSGFGFSYKRWDHPNSLLAICGTKQDGLNYMVCWLIIDRSHRLVERSFNSFASLPQTVVATGRYCCTPNDLSSYGRFLAVQMNHHTSMSEGNTFGTRF